MRRNALAHLEHTAHTFHAPHVARAHTRERLTDAQLLYALLHEFEHNVSALARALDLRRETIARWRDRGASLDLFVKNRKLLFRLLHERTGR